MTKHDDDERYEDEWRGNKSKRSQRTKFRDWDEIDESAAKRDKNSSKRSHRQKTVKDDFWPDADE